MAKMNKSYKIQLSMYGTVSERADVIIKAKSESQAEKIALKMAEEGEIKFSNDQDAVDGWEYQVEAVEQTTSSQCSNCMSDISDKEIVILTFDYTDSGVGYRFCNKECLVDFITEHSKRESQTCS